MLKNKTVVISGIGPGLGQELAYGAAEHGASCVLAARSEDKLAEVQEKIIKDGGKAFSVPTDITNQEDCKNLIIPMNNIIITPMAPYSAYVSITFISPMFGLHK